jgi:hypothetical protein
MAALLLGAATAGAAAPVPSAASATDIQGVSAVLRGSVEPGGEETTYFFEYVDQAGFEVGGFNAAAVTSAAAAGPGVSSHPAHAAISGLSPDTTYHARLRARNASGNVPGPPSTFATTHGFGFLPGAEGFAVSAIADGGGAATLAGSHPYEIDFDLGLNLGGEFEGQPGAPFPDGDLRDLRIQLPPGLILNTAVVPTCADSAFHAPRSSPFEAGRSGESCSDASQLGTVTVRSSLDGGAPRRFGVFNLKPPPGVPAEIGFAPFGAPIVLDVDLRQGADGSAFLALEAANFPQSLDLNRLHLKLWGVPWGVSHNGERGNCLNELEPAFPWAKCSLGTPGLFPRQALVTLPATCSGGSLAFTASANSWQQPATVTATAVNRDPGGEAAIPNCASLGFASHPSGLLTTRNASTASGFTFQLRNEEAGLVDPNSRTPSQVREAVVALPEGATINPSLGAGLGVCTPSQYAAETAASVPGEACPNSAKIGEFAVHTPLFEEWARGAIYFAQPDDSATAAPGAENPFDTLIAVYLVAKLPQRGVLIRLAGKLVPDPGTGRLTATFQGLPELPYDELTASFRATQRAPLISPPGCGAATTQIETRPWGGMVSAPRTSTDSQIDAGIGGGPCPNGSTPPFSPGVVAGGVNANVGSYTPYFVHLSRGDTEQEITSYSLVLPKGITARLAGIPFCPDAAIEAARSKRGAAETASASCPVASEIGHTLSGYGVGSALTYAPGRIYLAGPYHGQPLSIVTIDAATIGPFDLGTVVIRSAFSIDPYTAQLRIDSRASDPIPHILDGIPLHLRDIRVSMDRPRFTRNPSSCEPSELTSTLTGSGTRFGDPADDSVASVTSRFQLLNCRSLGFHPKLGLRLQGSPHRGAFPSLRATFASRGVGEANLRRIAVTMPHSLFLAQNHIRTICTGPQFDAERCPAGSSYGTAIAYTPLLDQPLRGPIYLRSSSHRLPDMVASLRSGSIHIVLVGQVGPAKHGIRVFFDEVPDAPIDRFVMTLDGGRRGLLVNSANICAAPPRATVKALGQNNLGTVFTSKLRGQCDRKHPKRERGGR